MAEPTNEQYPVTFSGIEKEESVVNTTKTILKSEYLTGGYLGNGDTLLALSHSQEFWAGKITDNEIKLMLRDPEIFKSFCVLKNGVLGDGVTFSPPVSQPVVLRPLPEGEMEDAERKIEREKREAMLDRYNLAKKYSDFTTRAFENLEIPLGTVLDDMMSALYYGNRVAEKVFEEKYSPEFGINLLQLKRLNVKPRKNTVFVVDKYNNLVGLKVWLKVKDENGNDVLKAKVVKKEKFAVLTFGMENGDPRGNSMLEAANHAWKLKVQLWTEYLRWIIYSAVPPIVGYTSDQTDSRKVLRGADGELVTDKDGNVVYESDVGALLKALQKVRNASAIALPHGAKVDTLNGAVSGDPFKGFRDVLNEEMEMALLHQTLATSDSRHNTRAASQTHISILDEAVWKLKGTVRDMVTGIVKHLMAVNFPNFDESLTPIVSLGDSSRRDFNGDVGSISQLSISKYIGESQKEGIDRILGLPPRDAFSDREFEREQTLEKLKLEAAVSALNSSDAGSTPTSSTGSNGENK